MWLTLLGGCLTYEEGQARVGELNCELADACGDLSVLGFDGVDACKDAARSQDYDECGDYDAAAMNGCIAEWEDAVDASSCEYESTDVCQVCG